MTTRAIEIWVGLFIAAGMAALFMLAMKVSNLSTYNSDGGFEVNARFDDISGLKVRSPVTMSGVRIGRVTGIEFDDQALQAVVTIKIDASHKTLPRYTSASIYSAGLLGEKYIGLEPGADGEEGEDKYLKPGAAILQTQDSLVLEKLIAQFISQMMSGDDKSAESK